MRLDQALVERKLAASRTLAQKLIESGVVTVSGVVTNKPSRKIEGSEPIEVTQQMPFISRGGEKLAHALDFFQVNASGLDCLDVGASTGGFTDCLLKRGAGQVFCVDSGSNQLHQTLRDHPKVSFREGFNARFMTPDDLKKNGAVVSLIKPQFELSSAELGRNGIVREEELREKAIQRVRSAAEEIGFQWHGLTESPIQGGGGNREFLCYLTR
jgi:23S rRNA (cytidine1920-2'-O)/16S rRNA (cytidine1409-2'-O)-methyltransferase